MARRVSKIGQAREWATNRLNMMIDEGKIKTRVTDEGVTEVRMRCRRCGGQGRLQVSTYGSIVPCRDCRGRSATWVTPAEYVEKTAKAKIAEDKKKEREARQEEARQRREEERHAAAERHMAEFSRQYPEEWKMLSGAGASSPRSRDFLLSLRDQVLRRGSLSENQIAALQKMAERGRQFEAERALKAEVSKFIGDVKNRYDFVLKINKTLDFEGDFGISTLHIMEDDEGNVFTWFSSSKKLQEGKWYPIRATVKAHTERDGVKQTQLTRGKVGEIVVRNSGRNKKRRKR